MAGGRCPYDPKPQFPPKEVATVPPVASVVFDLGAELRDLAGDCEWRMIRLDEAGARIRAILMKYGLSLQAGNQASKSAERTEDATDE